MSLAAFRGSRAEAEAMIESTTNDVIRRGEGIWLSVAEYSQAVLDNGIGHHDAALPPARKAAEQNDMALSAWATIELVEAAVRSGAMDTAVDVVARLAEWTSASGTQWALGVEARSRALISNETQAETLYRDAIEHLGRTRMRAELARTHLLYGEWLHAARRRDDARAQLRTAHQLFEAMGMQTFTERAARGLSATGERAREHIAETVRAELTEQELQVAHMAAAGLSNPEIGARLFISAKTVQYHLSKVFTKLSISSRGQLDHVLQQPPTTTQSE
jgi:ATP/maltotriose-dependent transcriptional regulator MalT